MPRIPRYPAPTNDAFLPVPGKPKPVRKPPSAAKRYATAMRIAKQLLEEQRQNGHPDLSQAGPLGVIGMFILMHLAVYKVEPEDLLEPNAMNGASSAVRRLIEQEFGGHIEYVFEFVRWTWARERKQFATRPPDNTFRISWRYQFCSKNLLTDYKVALSRQVGFG